MWSWVAHLLIHVREVGQGFQMLLGDLWGQGGKSEVSAVF